MCINQERQSTTSKSEKSNIMVYLFFYYTFITVRVTEISNSYSHLGIQALPTIDSIPSGSLELPTRFSISSQKRKYLDYFKGQSGRLVHMPITHWSEFSHIGTQN